MKVCKRCNEAKPLDQYVKDKKRADGLLDYCKKCARAHSLKYYQKYKTTDKYKEAHRKHVAKYLKRHNFKAKAHNLANLHKDKIKKDYCEGCGKADNLHMHHPNYNEPLNVITLCIKCHEEAHHGVAI